MKIEFVRKYRGKEIGQVEDVPDRVGHRFVNKGMAKFVEVKKPYKRKYASSPSKSKG